MSHKFSHKNWHRQAKRFYIYYILAATIMIILKQPFTGYIEYFKCMVLLFFSCKLEKWKVTLTVSLTIPIGFFLQFSSRKIIQPNGYFSSNLGSPKALNLCHVKLSIYLLMMLEEGISWCFFQTSGSA